MWQCIAALRESHREGASRTASPLHRRFGQRDGVGTDGRLLNVRCSAKTLSYLYAFDAYASALEPAQRDYVDPLTGLSAQPFIDLSRMIRHACEDPHLGSSLRETLDIEALRRCHQEALAQQSVLGARFARFAFSRTWELTACAA